MILIVDLNYEKDSLALYEFVLPIARIVKRFDSCEVMHYSQVNEIQLKKYSMILLSGTTIKDMCFSKNIGSFRWLKDCETPVLGICAGMQAIGITFGSKLEKRMEIGMKKIDTIKENILFSGSFSAYVLHNYSITPSNDFEVIASSRNCAQSIKHKEKNIYGVLFHPEVRNEEIIEKFIKYFKK